MLIQLKLMAMGKPAGFSLEEIIGFFGQDGMPDLPRSVFKQRANEINEKIEVLAERLETPNCPAPSRMECSSFRQLLGLPNSRKNK